MKKLGVVFTVFLGFWVMVDASCSRGCDLALASYFVGPGVFLSYIAEYLNTNSSAIISYTPDITNPNNVSMGSRVNVPFSCDCINGDFLGHVFGYQIQSGDTYTSIAQMTYSNLTTPSWIQRSNSYDPNRLAVGGNLNVTVNCSCGNSSVSPDYGLFITFPLRPGDSLNNVAQRMNVSASLLQRYNPDADFSAGTGLVYIPAQDRNGSYRPLTSGSSKDALPPSGGKRRGVIIGICVAVAAGLSAFSICWYLICVRGNKKEEALLSDKPKFELPTMCRDNHWA